MAFGAAYTVSCREGTRGRRELTAAEAALRMAEIARAEKAARERELELARREAALARLEVSASAEVQDLLTLLGFGRVEGTTSTTTTLVPKP